jgi:Phosphodiester glycosidase
MRTLHVAGLLKGLVTLALIAGLSLGAAGAGIYALTNVWPGLGTQGIDLLRHLIGEEAVATFETAVFDFQDQLQQWRYQLSGGQPKAPAWAVTPTALALATNAPLPTPSPTPAARTHPTAELPSAPLASTDTPIQTATPPPVEPPAWEPAAISPTGSLAGEGQWLPYLTNATTGQVVAYRTFLQPDTTRPYAIMSLVAFDLEATRLHFVLGLEEPQSPVVVRRTGTIPAADLQADVLLAAFNGGFKTEHGHFGVSVRGINLLPPRPGFSTVALFKDGRVQLGAWGTEVTASPDIIAWRQNGPLLVHNGDINPHTADKAPQDWGYTVKGDTATWRSALGLSADGRALYYAAGPSLTLPALAQGMATANATQAMQLDINPYWTHFDTFTADGPTLRPEPLLEAMRNQADNRYLKPNARDFFYVTLNK